MFNKTMRAWVWGTQSIALVFRNFVTKPGAKSTDLFLGGIRAGWQIIFMSAVFLENNRRVGFFRHLIHTCWETGSVATTTDQWTCFFWKPFETVVLAVQIASFQVLKFNLTDIEAQRTQRKKNYE